MSDQKNPHLTAGLAHDAKNMLSATMGHLQLLQSLLSPEDNGKITKHLSAALSGCQHLSYILHELKNLENDKIPEEERQPLSIKKTFANLQTLITPMIPPKVNFSVTIPRDGYLLGRKHQLEQVFLNLILNAVQAIPPDGEIALSVDYDEQRSPALAIIRVRDTGEGISPDKLPLIFTPFYSSKKKKGGSGLGLAMAHKIIVGHQGSITVQSEVGEGTCFTISIPLLSVEPHIVRNSSPSSTHMPKVLVIDDMTSLLSIMEDFLNEYGMSAETFTDPIQALEWTESHAEEIDLVILDMKLPTLSGKDCFYRYKEKHPHIPIVICSGAHDDAVEELLGHGAAQFFEKPLDYDEAMRKIQEILNSTLPQDNV